MNKERLVEIMPPLYTLLAKHEVSSHEVMEVSAQIVANTFYLCELNAVELESSLNMYQERILKLMCMASEGKFVKLKVRKRKKS